MRLRWAGDAQADLRRVREFVADKNPAAAARLVELLLAAPNRLLMHPHAGPYVDSMQGSGVRRILVGSYEMRYEVVGDVIRILRIFHMREER